MNAGTKKDKSQILLINLKRTKGNLFEEFIMSDMANRQKQKVMR